MSRLDISLFLSSLLFIFSCSSSIYKKTASSINNERIISLEKTACLGKCPVFKILIYQNNQGLYIGTHSVKNIGKYQFSINNEMRDSIINLSKEISFAKINEYQYFDSFIQDLPSTVITIKNHRVQYNMQYSEKLKRLEDYIYEICMRQTLF